MKKLLILALALVMVLCLCACGSSAPANEGASAIVQNNNANNAPDADDNTAGEELVAGEAGFVFTANGVEITMNAPAEDILAALGEPKSYTEQASCAFEGLDKTYFFGSFYLQTYPGTDGDYIYSLWLVDDTMTTAEGIYIGAAQQDVDAAYGAENFDNANSYTVTKGDSILTIILSNGVVSSIQYDAVLN